MTESICFTCGSVPLLDLFGITSHQEVSKICTSIGGLRVRAVPIIEENLKRLFLFKTNFSPPLISSLLELQLDGEMHSFPGVVDPSILLGNDVVHHRLKWTKNYVLAHASFSTFNIHVLVN